MHEVADAAAFQARGGYPFDPLGLIGAFMVPERYSARDLALLVWAADVGRREGQAVLV